ncbi:hypothetical protein TNCV_258511 [Trichonephila clavipes]|uniref:Uncharacterized protein n=1 Tax=Trichonephila clavipes TaxID=2585209 RepID=A0A8X6V9H6_TRICX|nr:hypothetical protein TNCV_258511 [Trichonephila clavipes]
MLTPPPRVITPLYGGAPHILRSVALSLRHDVKFGQRLQALAAALAYWSWSWTRGTCVLSSSSIATENPPSRGVNAL